MRKLFLVLLILNASIWAQTVVPQALNETLNLAPRFQRGDAQVYSLFVEMTFLDDQGQPTKIKRNRVDFTQICLANTPDSGVVYEVTIDSFLIGAMERMDADPNKWRSVVDTLMGHHFTTQFRAKIPVTGNCYDAGVPLTENARYIEGSELIEDFFPAKLTEQLRYTVGRRLSKVGDTVTIAWPKPICYSVKEVINSSKMDQKPFKLSLSGLTSYRGIPCATVSVASTTSPYRVEIYSTDTSSFVAEGTALTGGEYQVSLDKGRIVHLKMTERSDMLIKVPDGTTKKNRVLKTTELTPRIW
jgi:hypothetical protein